MAAVDTFTLQGLRDLVALAKLYFTTDYFQEQHLESSEIASVYLQSHSQSLYMNIHGSNVPCVLGLVHGTEYRLLGQYHPYGILFEEDLLREERDAEATILMYIFIERESRRSTYRMTLYLRRMCNLLICSQDLMLRYLGL